MGLFNLFRKDAPKGKQDEAGSTPSTYNTASKIAGLIDNTPLEMLTNKEMRIILFQDPTGATMNELNVCFVSTKMPFPFKAVADVSLSTLNNYETLIEFRRSGLPGTVMYTDLLATDAATAL